jgi:hypothetical protein
MKLIVETIEDVKYITEKREDGKKNLYIEGVFMQGGIKNRNGRMYPIDVLVNESARYTKELVEKNRAYGELGHPSGPSINLDRASHRIVELRHVGGSSGDIYGKAMIMDTPMGNIARGIIESGGSLGVSSRGMGTIKESKDGLKEVQNDFFLATAADIVADPSAPDAFVQGIMEGVEWVWDNGLLKAQKLAGETKRQIDEASKSRTLTTEKKIAIFEAFLTKLASR